MAIQNGGGGGGGEGGVGGEGAGWVGHALAKHIQKPVKVLEALFFLMELEGRGGGEVPNVTHSGHS